MLFSVPIEDRGRAMPSFEIPSDAPDASLARVARRLRVPFSRGFVMRAVAAHPRAQSLLALVEVAPTLGMKVTAAEVDPSALGELHLPAIVHFRDGGGEGFGVIEKVRADVVEVWDGAHGRRTVGRGDFIERWSGIVALVERAGRPTSNEPGHRRARVAESLFNVPRPVGMFGRAGRLLRVLFGALLVALVAAAVMAGPGRDRVAAAAVALLSGLGLTVSIVAALATSAEGNPLSERVCARGKLVDCHSVLTSKYARVFGISLSDVGVAFFGAVLLLLSTRAARGPSPETWGTLAIAFAASAPASLLLTALQVKLRRVCVLCLGVHVAVLAGTALTWSALRPVHWEATPVIANLSVFVLLFVIVLFFVAAYFRKAHGLEVVTALHRRVSGSPFASLADLLTQAPTGTRGAELGVRLGAAGAVHELTVLVHPSCNRCTPVMQEVAALARSGLVDAYVGLVPKDPTEADRDACAAVVAAGLSLGSDRLYDVYGAAKRAWRELSTGDPVHALARELDAAGADLHASLGAARALVGRSEKIVDAHAEGTPAVLFDGRVFRGPLSHLAMLLTEHPELLEPLRLAQEPESPARG